MRYFARIKYVGTAYCGFQWQPHQMTVQEALNRACRALFGVECAVTGCSRTDSGVHAEDFCMTIDVPKGGAAVPPSALPRAIIPHLPDDISLFHAEEADESFHARYDVKQKEYCYRIHLSPVPDPFYAHRAWHFPYPIREDAIERMRLAASYLVGMHDFSAFKSDDGTEKETCRTVDAIEIVREGDMITVSVAANGFLYHMVRIITGTLMDVAVGRMTPKDVQAALESRARKNAGVTAPPDGLYLYRVTYNRMPKQ